MSIASRVVPGNSLTIARSLRVIELINEDLPTFGRPMIAMLSRFSMVDGRFSISEAVAGKRGLIASSNSEMPRPCAELIETALSKPSDAKSAARFSCFGSSILLMTSTIGFCDLRRRRASSRSIGDSPCFASTTKRRTSLSCKASSAARCACATSSDAPAPPTPPVSQSMNGLGPRVQMAESRSRVTPG